MRVVKFGGSSLSDASQLKKVLDIVKQDDKRQIIVVSAPGKRNKNDIKITDALIKYFRNYINHQDFTENQKWIIKRYKDIIDALSLSQTLFEEIKQSITNLSSLPIEQNDYLYDNFLSEGENLNAKIIAEFFRKNGLDATYVHPKEAGLIVSSEPSNARILPSSYDKIENLARRDQILVIPGFFGVTKDNQICTFSRGGSDITGAILAAGIKAESYENFTDVDGIFAAHPGIINNPESIKELTYREMRELAYAGFSVLHDEALIPAYRGKIPLIIKNTNNPNHPGTKIVLKRENNESPVVGISGDKGFVSINISKYLMNREIGFGKRLLQILEDLNISWEHMPTGIDDLSIVLRERELTPIKEQEIITRFTRELEVDTVSIEHHLSIIMIVGENMKNHIGVTAKATQALSIHNINLSMISQGSSEVSVLFVIKTEEEKKAIKALYKTFFNNN